MKNIFWFESIGADDTAQVGGKGANLGEMAGLGLPIPPGFVVSAGTYKTFLAKSGLDRRIKAILEATNVNNPEELADASRKIKRLIISSPVPEEISAEIISSYLLLGKRVLAAKSRFRRLVSRVSGFEAKVAVRSSATAEDSKTASFAGQNETFLNISGEASVVDAVRRCWASLFEARSIFYREQQKLNHFKSFIAVIVQVLVPADVSGVMFSVDPVTNNKSRIVIEAIWGLGEYIVQGKVTPDHYEVDKADLTIVEERVVRQDILLTTRRNGETRQQVVAESLRNKQKLSAVEIKKLTEYCRLLERHYYFPQDSEFAIADHRIYIVQTRPITTIENRKQKTENKSDEVRKLELLLTGAPASPGISSGPVQILKSAKEIGRVSPGEILVAEQTNPDFVPAMKKAGAIVTDKGGRTSHAAIVSRELGIPCVVGTGKATKVLRNGMVITVDGLGGKVYKGVTKVTRVTAVTPVTFATEKTLKTATKVYVNLAEPERAKEVAALNCDGVGLLRAEFMLANIGIHPKKAISDGRQRQFTTQLAEQIATIVSAFYPRPVVYRATDFKTNEYRNLPGGERFEPKEENPMIGFRGAYRYVVQPDVFKMEIEAIRIVRERMGFKNLSLMIPFCRKVSELAGVKALVNRFGLERSVTFKLWMMCEIPSNVILLDKFIEVGIDGVSVGSNDLTMLTLGVDRDNENVALEYDERDEALLLSYERITKTCRKYNVTCSICGQAPSDFPDLTEKLVAMGITSVSVNPDVVDRTREIIYEAERKLVISH